MKTFILALSLLLLSCSAPTVFVQPNSNHVSITNHSVVTLIEPVELSDSDGVPNGISYGATCSAFCVLDVDKPYLVTAAHCVRGLAPGSRFRYLSVNGVGSKEATVEYIGSTGDRAVASVNDTDLVPFIVDASYQPSQDDEVIAISSYYESNSTGKVIGELSHGWYDTNQTINFGWSGSPVVNRFGLAWGIVSMCHLSDNETDCDPGYAIISSIY